jgi:ATP-binding cassette subfamily B protein
MKGTVESSTNRDNLPGLLRSLWSHLEPRRQRQFGLLLILMLVSALAEVVSLGAVLPFLGILTAPAMVFQHPAIAGMAGVVGITSADQLVLPLAVVFAVAAVLAGAIRILLLWASTRLAYASGADISIDVYRRTLNQPYQVHVARNSSTVLSAIGKVDGAINVLYQVLTLISSTVLLSTVMVALIAIDPKVAIASASGFGAVYVLITWLSRRKLRSNSRRIASERTQVIKAMQEGLGGIRDVLLDGTQPVYCDIYRQSDLALRRAQGNNAFIAASPRFAMEALGMVLIAALAYVLSRQVGGITSALPVLGALALGAQRLLPALQHGYSAWASIAGSHASLADIVELLNQPLPAEHSQPQPEPAKFTNNIAFKEVRFRYADSAPWVLDGFSLSIPKGVRVGFIGRTGSGKSTALDILMGLLTPTEGELLVDGLTVRGSRIRAWQRTIAHVPQSIYLADTTLAENIAFGVPRGAIDMQKVRQAASQAQIAEFIESRPQGYDALVGERGIRLSGGQRQRIGIARALYKQASVLVFDEATSALDTATEQSVMDAIEGLDRELTILIIAHRLSTVQRCDIIVRLEFGQIVERGKYQDLIGATASAPAVNRNA